jgi:glycosyltransferase involved in cell wall biosynthesis
MSGKANLAVVILTFNESLHLHRALTHLAGLAQEIFVIDSYSTDDTLDIARSFGAQILQHPFENQARQFQWALDNAPITAAWVMRLDADEVVESDLADEIAAKLPLLPDDVTGVILNRKTIFQGKFIRHGGRYPMLLLRIWRRSKAQVEDRWMDEHIVLTEGRSVVFNGGFADHNLNDLTAFTAKHNQYASREALDVFCGQFARHDTGSGQSLKNTARQARVKRFLKESVYNRIPFEFAAFGYFIYRYLLQFGFLDGRIGLRYHVLQCFWYRFLVGAKLLEMQNETGKSVTDEEIRGTLLRLTGQKSEALDLPGTTRSRRAIL